LPFHGFMLRHTRFWVGKTGGFVDNMEKEKTYYGVSFSSHIIKQAYDTFWYGFDLAKVSSGILKITQGDVSWNYDTLDEFLAEYPNFDRCHLSSDSRGERLRLVAVARNTMTVEVESKDRRRIESVFSLFENNLPNSVVVTSPNSVVVTSIGEIRVFIGHGKDGQWRDLKDHLQDKHGFKVEAYEVGPRAGLSVKEVLESMMNQSSFALLVLTGEDIKNDGEVHARENVIHELGLFQGHLGFRRAVALLEDGVHEFSNILGINQIRFSKGAIRETFGDVLSILKAEFASK